MQKIFFFEFFFEKKIFFKFFVKFFRKIFFFFRFFRQKNFFFKFFRKNRKKREKFIYSTNPIKSRALFLRFFCVKNALWIFSRVSIYNQKKKKSAYCVSVICDFDSGQLRQTNRILPANLSAKNKKRCLTAFFIFALKFR